MGAAISKIKNFNPNDWGSSTADDDTPIKAIISLLLDILKLAEPLVSLSENSVDLITNVILSNKFVIELLIVILPTIPILYLLNYFVETI